MNITEQESVKNWIKRILNDPFSKILLENSQFTEIQLETLLIDILGEKILDKKINYTVKSSMRLNKKISRGAFNRTLQQARKNMVKSILTVLLLGYLKVLETLSLNPFIEASNKLENYIEEYEEIRKKFKSNPNDDYLTKSFIVLQNNLKNEIYDLIKPKKNFYDL